MSYRMKRSFKKVDGFSKSSTIVYINSIKQWFVEIAGNWQTDHTPQVGTENIFELILSSDD